MAKMTPVNAGTQYITPLRHEVVGALAIDPRQTRQDSSRSAGQRNGSSRRSLYDLLFYEVDNLDQVEPPVREQLKENIRDFFREKRRERGRRRDDRRPPPAEAELPAPEPDPVAAAAPADQPQPEGSQGSEQGIVVPGEDSFRQQQLMELMLPGRSAAEKERVLHAIGIANQLKTCLAMNNDAARRVSLYLRALLIIDDDRFRPTFIIEV